MTDKILLNSLKAILKTRGIFLNFTTHTNTPYSTWAARMNGVSQLTENHMTQIIEYLQTHQPIHPPANTKMRFEECKTVEDVMALSSEEVRRVGGYPVIEALFAHTKERYRSRYVPGDPVTAESIKSMSSEDIENNATKISELLSTLRHASST